jgi:hypothetical protein
MRQGWRATMLKAPLIPADVQDRDGARQVLRMARRLFPFTRPHFADAGYQGPKMAKAVAHTGCWTIEIVKRSDAHRFVVLPEPKTVRVRSTSTRGASGG